MVIGAGQYLSASIVANGIASARIASLQPNRQPLRRRGLPGPNAENMMLVPTSSRKRLAVDFRAELTRVFH
jgi:hypothetical protein